MIRAATPFRLGWIRLVLRVALALLGCAATVATADPEPPPGLDVPACGTPLSVRRVLATGVDSFTGAASANGDAVLVGALPGPMLGTVAFVRTQRVWRAYAVESQGAPQAVYRTRGGAVFVWSMLSTEGPGSSLTGFAIAPGGKRFCTGITFPAGLNRPQWANEYLELTRFNLSAAGRGVLVGRASDGPLRRWRYVYRSGDGGRHWSAPQHRVQSPPAPGDYRPLSLGHAPAALVASLRRG